MESAREAFQTEQLIFVPTNTEPGQGTWVGLDSCIWDGPKFLKYTHCLQETYPRLKRFFCEMLNIGKATLKTILEESQHFNRTNSLDYLSQVFVSMNRFLTMEVTKPTQSSFHGLKFPVLVKETSTRFDWLVSAGTANVWFIADRLHLRQSFEGLIPLLAMEVEVVDQLRPLIEFLDLGPRLLSKVAQGVPRIKGLSTPCAMYTSSLRAKSRCLARYVMALATSQILMETYQCSRLLPSSLANRGMVIAQLRQVEVYSAEKLIIEWQMSIPGDLPAGKIAYKVVGRTDSGRVKMIKDENHLKIILRKDDVDPARPPLELQEEMSNFCGITDGSHLAILHWLLGHHDLEEIEYVLQRRGVTNVVPELDEQPRELSDGDELEFSGLNAEPLDSRTDNQFFRRTEKTTRQGNAVQQFVAKFNLANDFQKSAAQPWHATEAQNMLSHICRLEHIDPYLLLPQRRSPWTQKVKDAGGYPDDLVAIVFDEKGTTNGKAFASRVTQNFPATVNVAGTGKIQVAVSATMNKMADEEIQFAGELHVSVYSEP